MATLEKIGKYEILAKIGEGGFGIVYKGKDPFIKRLVAVKTCSSENEAIQKRFFREAEIAGNLHHANVVTIHDFGVEGETPYLVQEFLTGEDLDVLISSPDHQLSLPVKVRYLRGIGEGLRYAHAQGVIHRDIKPANIRILENNRVKVMDFGIAKLRDQESQLTQTGMALGTVAYMSPEQLKGESVDHRVDIFSFGVLAYELVVGKRPFQAESVSTLFYQLLHENAPEITDPEVPKQLVEVIEKCLAKSLEVRYGSFDEVLADLAAVQKLVGDGDEAVTADPFSTDPRSALTRLAAKAARSIDAGDLTAAQVTLDLARKEYDANTFDRDFGELVRALEEKRATRTTGHPGIPGIDVESQIARIDSQLEAGKIDTAAVAFTALEMQFPGDARVQQLRSRVSQAVNLPPAFDTPQSSASAAPPSTGIEPTVRVQTAQAQAQPSSTSGAASRQKARTGPLVAALAAVVLLVVLGAIFLVRFLGGSGPASDVGQGEQTQPLDDQSVDQPSTGPATPDGADAGEPGESDAEGDGSAPTSPTGEDAAGAGSQDAGAGSQNGGTDSQQASGAATPPSRTSGGARDDASTSSGNGGSSQGSRPDRGSSTTPSSSGGQRPSGSGGERSSSSGGSAPPSSSQPRDTQPRDSRATPITARTDPGSQGGATSEPEETAPSSTPTQSAEPPPATEPEQGAGFDLERFRIQNDIRAVLDAYRDAWISRDEDLINRYYPGENATRRDVRQFRTVEADVTCNSFDIQDNGATAACTITIVKRPRNGNPVTVRYTQADLVKQGTRWVIAGLR